MFLFLHKLAFETKYRKLFAIKVVALSSCKHLFHVLGNEVIGGGYARKSGAGFSFLCLYASNKQ